MRWLGLFASALGALLAVSVGQQASETALREQARAAADALLQRLVGRLNQEYQQGGAGRGVQVCVQVAQTLTREVAREQGVQMRRVSLKNRNPRNAPDA